MSDPVAEHSGFLRMYMSYHPGTLVTYAKWYGKITETITAAEMTAIDSQSMTLECMMQGGKTQVVSISLDPPLLSYDEAKVRLLEMKADAQEGLGMIPTPQLKSFYLARGAIITGAIAMCMCYCTFVPSTSTPPVFAPAERLFYFLRHGYTLRLLWTLFFIFHAVEGLYTYTLCRKYQTGSFIGASYVIATFLFGFPVWIEMRRRIQAARIRSLVND